MGTGDNSQAGASDDGAGSPTEEESDNQHGEPQANDTDDEGAGEDEIAAIRKDEEQDDMAEQLDQTEQAANDPFIVALRKRYVRFEQG